jgi:uncharacterized protein (DUF58 family)
MTSRCRTLMIMAGLGLILGLIRRQPALALVSMSTLVWIFFCALWFYTRVLVCWRSLECHRELKQHHTASRKTLWVDRKYCMTIRLRSTKGPIPGLTVFRDLPPETISVPASLNPAWDDRIDCRITESQTTANIQYHCLPLAAGQARFFGVHCQFQDPQGFFLFERVLRQEHRFRILPGYDEIGDPRSRIKRTNALPQHGIHQLKRAGFGGELLELREYQPGDPPKSIAWKVSARRDRLMTRQYESEVPIRMTLLIDAAPSVYAGLPGNRLIDQANYLAASIARSAVAVGDSIGIILLSDDQIRRFAPGGGDRSFYQILDLLSKSSQPPRIPGAEYDPQLMELAIAVCRERFPELMELRINRGPVSIFVVRPRKRKRIQDRMQISNVLAELYHLGPMETIRIQHDDYFLADYLRRFLCDCDRAWVPPLFDADMRGKLRFDTPTPRFRRSEAIASELSLSVARARDNEVFVLMLNLFDNGSGDPVQEFEALIPAIKVAIGRHHRVVVIAGSTTDRRRLPVDQPLELRSSADVLEHAERLRVRRITQQFAKRLRGLGATFAVSGRDQIVPIVMAEAELAGTGRSRGREQLT